MVNEPLRSEALDALAALEATRVGGVVSELTESGCRIRGLAGFARIGDAIRIEGDGVHADALGEIVSVEGDEAVAMTFSPLAGVGSGRRVWLSQRADPRPSEAWLGRVIDADGACVRLGAPLAGGAPRALRAAPPPALMRRAVGARLSTGHAVFDTILPLCAGQRIGVFAGSGVGKSRLMGAMAQRMTADVVVVGLIGERGREVREFVDKTMGPEAMARSVVVAATSDQPAALKRRAAWLAMATAEHFRDEGRNVLLMMDSLTRFAEAHREVALTAGESASLMGFPPSTVSMIAGLAERAGPGPDRAGVGDITAIFTVLVAGSDMEEPVADMTRGILDGHVVLSREIAERGRFPAVDVRRSVSRSLPDAATDAENALISEARRLLAAYEEAAPMIQIGLYKRGADPQLDRAVALWPRLDRFFAEPANDPTTAFAALAEILGRTAPNAA